MSVTSPPLTTRSAPAGGTTVTVVEASFELEIPSETCQVMVRLVSAPSLVGFELVEANVIERSTF